jgi:RNA ligase (TIGR02306 family)
VKLKGQLSQGLLLKTDSFSGNRAIVSNAEGVGMCFEVDDPDCILTEHLGILKYEKPLPAQLSGMAKGNFPSFIPKTDQPRIQNIKAVIEECKAKGYTFEKTEKLDGSSLTVYVNKGVFGVCSRNLDLQYDLGNTFWKTAVMQGLVSFLLQYYLETGRSLALQGEMLGEGIQGNSYKISGSEFYLFDIWDIDQQKYLAPQERTTLMAEDFWRIAHVPIVNTKVRLEVSIEEMLHQAEGNSFVNQEAEREGFVYKCNEDPSISFKCISNAWLLKND